MTAIYEPVATTDLARILQGMAGPATVEPEPTHAFPGGRRPDLLITAPGRSPVVVEARQSPAANLEEDAAARFGLNAVIGGRELEAVIALRYPAGMTALDASTPLEYAALTRRPGGIDRFPDGGWITGNAADLAEFARLISVPQHEVEDAISKLESGVNDAAGILAEAPPLTLSEITAIMGLPASQAKKRKGREKAVDATEQTRGMAAAIVANAMIFHEHIEGRHPVPKLRECVDGNTDSQSALLAAWDAILEINYWPIFHVGRGILDELPAGLAQRVISRLYRTARGISSSGVTYAHDVTGRLLQRFITDRKYLASFYTLPPSAALLARLAVGKLQGVDWCDANAIGKLKIADFACGTGALLGAVYEQVAARHEQAGGKAEELHRAMIEDVLYGCDVMPAAIHITGSTLSAIQPGQDYGRENLYQASYGRLQNGSVSVGSLELLNSTGFGMGLINTEMSRIGGMGREDASGAEARMMDGSFDLAIMNPPFTRAGSDWDEAGQVRREDDYIKQFRGLDTSLSVQEEMRDQLTRYARNTCYHGFAGLGSAFAALADRKIKPGGVIALVLSLAAASGASWEKLRRMLAQDYNDITVVSLASNSRDEGGMAFSADTGMGECLIIARKRRPDEEPNGRARFVSLNRRPMSFVDAHAMAQAIHNVTEPRGLEDGPYGGTGFAVGDKPAGTVLDAPIGKDGEGWGAIRLEDCALAQTAYALSQGRLWMPGQAHSIPLPVAPLGEMGRIGLNDTNIAGTNAAPFRKAPASPTATYPALWNHDANRETRMVCEPDWQLEVKQGMEVKAAERWATASRAHISRGFRFNSQQLSIAFTERETMGGRGWPSVQFNIPRLDYSLAVWGNSTLGLLSYWWHSTRPQDGRGDITVLTAATIPVLDFRALSDEQLAATEGIFDEFRELELLPAYLADADANRALLDRRVVCDLLGFGEDVYRAVRRLAAKWCAEPSVHGGKSRE